MDVVVKKDRVRELLTGDKSISVPVHTGAKMTEISVHSSENMINNIFFVTEWQQRRPKLKPYIPITARYRCILKESKFHIFKLAKSIFHVTGNSGQ